jgi:hypothetical protein
MSSDWWEIVWMLGMAGAVVLFYCIDWSAFSDEDKK